MEEKIIAESEMKDTIKPFLIITFIASLALLFVPAIVTGYSAFPVFGFSLIMSSPERMWGFIWIAGFACLVIFFILFFTWLSYKNSKIVVTDKRVYGVAKSSKRVDLPLDSISAVGSSGLGGLAITSASGAIRFKFIKNRDEIYDKLSQLLIDRQGKAGPTTTIKQEIPQSNADELQKFKNLLDSGVITQEEFDAKKKDLLGL